jgi:crotonobetainyl-CoA:carnitine CoA-transferase CaiB-like acyl-CoA transferase
MDDDGACADLLTENFRPGVLARLALCEQRLLELNPRLVVLSITGFGHDSGLSSTYGS